MNFHVTCRGSNPQREKKETQPKEQQRYFFFPMGLLSLMYRTVPYAFLASCKTTTTTTKFVNSTHVLTVLYIRSGTEKEKDLISSFSLLN
jgi:hypothetical protein